MSLKKVTLASLILLSLTACSGGSKQDDNHNKVLSDTKLALKNADNKKIELEKALDQANTKLSEVEKKLNENKDKIAISSEELQKQKAELAKLAKEKSNLENQLNTVNEKLVGATNEKEDIETQLTKVNKEKKSLTEKLVEANANLKTATDNLNTLEKSKRATEAELTETRSQVEAAQAEKEATKTQLENANNEKAALEDQLKTANANLKTATDNLNTLEKSKRATEAELTETRSQVEAAQAEKEATKTQLENANNEKAALEDKLKTANADLETAKADKESAETKLADKQAVIDAIHHHAFNNLPKKFYSTLGDVDYGTLSIGLHKMPFVFINNISDDPEDNELGTGDLYVYKQTHFSLEATSIKMGTTDDRPHSGSFRVDKIVGTRTENLPSQGTVTYRGTAFNADNRGNLTYRINFADKTGSGELSNFTHWGNIQLAQGQISDSSIIKSDASMADGTTGKYEVTLFGPNAEEIAGEVYMFKQLNEGILSNGGSAKKYDYSSRGTMFGLAGTRSDTE